MAGESFTASKAAHLSIWSHDEATYFVYSFIVNSTLNTFDVNPYRLEIIKSGTDRGASAAQMTSV